MLPVPDGYTSTEGRNITVQCFPLYSIMLAVNRSLIDVFSLDIEGDELKVLKTIPLHKLLIKVRMSVTPESDSSRATFSTISNRM